VHFSHKFLQVAITFFVFGLGEKLHITQCALIVHCLLSLLKTFKFTLISLFANVVANVEVVINPKWDALQTIVIDSIKDFVSLTLIVKWK
jgi:hypothetical protein